MTQAHTQCRIKEVKDWREIRRKKSFTTSPTQHETFDLCKRKWWFDRVRFPHLPQKPSKGQAFGTILHAVAERYLRADDLGRDPETGQPVELYPTGWHTARNKYTGEAEGEVTPDEQDRIKRMIAEAIQSGVLQRQPGRQIEREFRKTLLELDDAKVSITGFIDLHTEREVQDHKTSKSPRWFKSQDALRRNTQALLYAKVLLDEGQDIKEVTIRHNQFCTDPDNPLVRKTEVRVPAEEIEREWRRVEENAREMVVLRHGIEEWHHIPDPESREKACNAYGGCRYRDICYGMESVQGFENRLTKITIDRKPIQQYNPVVPRPPKGSTAMSNFAARIAQMSQGTAAPAAPPALNPSQPGPPPQPASTPEAAIAATPAPQQAEAPTVAAGASESPPWSDPGCKACEGRGFNSNGHPCRICDVTASKRGVPDSNQYIIEPVGEGRFVWESRNGSGAGASPTPSAKHEVKSQERVAEQPTPAPTPAPAPTPTPAPTPAPAPAPTPAPAPVEQGEPTLKNFTGSPGRPKRGFILCVNCQPTRGQEKKMGNGRYVHYLHKILDEIGSMMVEEARKGNSGIEHITDIDVWQRRDKIAQVGQAIADDFGTDIVVADGISTAQSDLRTLFDAIRPYAGMEIHPGGLTA
jgi:hypothetical protein